MARQNTVVGLDIGKYAVKAAWAERRGKTCVVTRTEYLRLPTDRSDIESIIGPWIEKTGIARYPCVLGVSGANTIFQPLFLPPEDLRTFEQATAIEVVKFNEMASETMVHGYTPINVNPGERRLLLAMARPSILDEALGRGRHLGLDPIDAMPTPVAMFNALEQSAGAHEAPNLYINIGYSGSEVAVGSKAGLLFARGFAGGGQMFTDALAKETNSTSSQAENLKLTEGSLVNGSSTYEAFSRVADLWLSEVQSCMSVYNSLFGERRTQPAAAILCGGGSELRGLAEYASARLGMPVSVSSSIPGRTDAPRTGNFVVATGLAAAGLRSSISHLSLLPADLRDEMMFRRQKGFWFAAGVAAVLILAVSLLGGFTYSIKMQKHNKVQLDRLAKRQQLAADIETIKARNGLMLAMATPIKELLATGPAIRDILTVVAKSKAPGDSIIALTDADSYFSRQWATAQQPQPRGMRDRRRTAAAAAPTMADKPGFETVILEGFTRTPNLSTVKDLIIKLGASGLVEKADLLSDDKLMLDRSQDGNYQHYFVIEIRLRKQ